MVMARYLRGNLVSSASSERAVVGLPCPLPQITDSGRRLAGPGAQPHDRAGPWLSVGPSAPKKRIPLNKCRYRVKF